MSYESKLDERSGKLINPAQLCLLLSIALHLLVLKFGLPTIGFNNDSGRREVSIVELNPEQQARLPDLYPQLETPEVPENQPPESDLDEPVAPFAIPPSLIPGIGDSTNLPRLVIPPPPQFDLPPLPPQTDITLPPVGDLSNLPFPPTLDPSDFRPEAIELPPNIGKIPEPQIDLVPQRPSAQPPATKPQTQPQPPQPPNEPEKKPEPKLTPEQIAARREAEFQQRIRNLRQDLTRTEAGTTDEAARKNYVAWLAKVRDIEPDKIEIEGTYPRDACIRRLKGSSVFGVVVNTQGEVVALDLIKGAKYPVFDRQTSENLGDRTFDNETERPKPYQVTVNYEYDSEICPSLTLPSIRRTQEQQQPPSSEEDKPELPTPETSSEEDKPEATPEPQPTLEEDKPEPSVEDKPEATPEPSLQEDKPSVEDKPETQSEKNQPEPSAEEESEAQPTSEEDKPEPNPLPSLRDRLRNIPLPDRKPSDLKDVPLPDRPNLRDR